LQRLTAAPPAPSLVGDGLALRAVGKGPEEVQPVLKKMQESPANKQEGKHVMPLTLAMTVL